MSLLVITKCSDCQTDLKAGAISGAKCRQTWANACTGAPMACPDGILHNAIATSIGSEDLWHYPGWGFCSVQSIHIVLRGQLTTSRPRVSWRYSAQRCSGESIHGPRNLNPLNLLKVQAICSIGCGGGGVWLLEVLIQGKDIPKECV